MWAAEGEGGGRGLLGIGVGQPGFGAVGPDAPGLGCDQHCPCWEQQGSWGFGQPGQPHKKAGEQQIAPLLSGIEPGEKVDESDEDKAGHEPIWVQLAGEGDPEGVERQQDQGQGGGVVAQQPAQREKADQEQQGDTQGHPASAGGQHLEGGVGGMALQPRFKVFAFPGEVAGGLLGVFWIDAEQAECAGPHHGHAGVFALEGAGIVGLAERVGKIGRAGQPFAFVGRDIGIERRGAREPCQQKEPQKHKRRTKAGVHSSPMRMSVRCTWVLISTPFSSRTGSRSKVSSRYIPV